MSRGKRQCKRLCEMQRGAQGFLDRLVIQSLADVNGHLWLTGRIIQE
jgi:hypothetical protein